MEIADIIKEKPEGTKAFPIYPMDTLEKGKVFAEASMGFLGKVEYGVRGEQITVRTSTERPVIATLGCQLAGWQMGEAMISGPLRMKVKKPGFIYEKVDFGHIPELPDVACVEGDITETGLINGLLDSGVHSAEILLAEENSPAQFINIPARAIEIALFRLSFLTDINEFKITKAMSTITTSTQKEDLNSELNDAIRFHGNVTLVGKFNGFRDFEPIVTKNAGFSDQTFGKIISGCGSVANCPLEVFSVSQLTVIDGEKTRAF